MNQNSTVQVLFFDATTSMLIIPDWRCDMSMFFAPVRERALEIAGVLW